MMQAIYKYRLPPEFHPWVAMPKGAKVLSVQDQRGMAVIWVLANPREPIMVRHWFYVVATGREVGIEHDLSSSKFIGTIQLENGDLVFHVFDNGEGWPVESPMPPISGGDHG